MIDILSLDIILFKIPTVLAVEAISDLGLKEFVD